MMIDGRGVGVGWNCIGKVFIGRESVFSYCIHLYDSPLVATVFVLKSCKACLSLLFMGLQVSTLQY
jgi:hypothetical protein